LQQLAQQSVVSVGSVWTATKLFHICPYEITVAHEINLWVIEIEEVCLIGLSISLGN
jgi:hypothetical protein